MLPGKKSNELVENIMVYTSNSQIHPYSVGIQSQPINFSQLSDC